MPTYTYECSTHGEFEEFHSMSSIYKECPKCKEEGKEPGDFKQLINCTTKGVVELTGNELTAKIKEDTKKLAKDIHSSEKTYSNILGEAKYESLQRSLDKGKRERR